MKNILLAAGLMAAVPMISSQISSQAFAQGAPQTLVSYKVDVAKVSSGYRSSKVVGASVVNEANEKVGTLDDLIVTRDDRVVYAIVSVGGFLGMGDKLVAVPFAELTLSPDKTLMPGATKDALKALPKFVYAK